MKGPTVAKSGKEKLFLGVDVGGTKTLAAVVAQSGEILVRNRAATPRRGTARDALRAILSVMGGALKLAGIRSSDLSAIGLSVPGVVDPDKGLVVVTPNMNLTGLAIREPAEKRFGVPVAVGNDVNVGTLGEKWLGAARYVESAVGIFVGTGIGGGVILGGKLVRGSREGAGEIGHIVMMPGGPLCGCGNRGCLEALASRSAIERDIRKAIAAGRKCTVARLIGTGRQPIKSKVLKDALKAKDPVVTRVMRKASEILGYACLTVRHLVDPDVIILGGGVIEACGKFVLPIVQKIVAADALAGARPGGLVVESELGDDAVVLGAAAMAQEHIGGTPLKDAAAAVPSYPKVEHSCAEEAVVGGKAYTADVVIRGDGKVKPRFKKGSPKDDLPAHQIGPEELERVCKGGPALLVIGTGLDGHAGLTPEGEEFLRQRRIEVRALPSPKAVKEFNRAKGRKAAIIHISC